MTTPIPAAGYPSDSSRSQSDMQTYFETMLSIQKEVLGGTSEAASVELSSHSFTPGNNECVCVIDTASMASTDTLNTIDATNVRDGEVIVVRSTNEARVITVANAAGGAGQILTADGTNVVLSSTQTFMALKYNAAITAFEEMFRSPVAVTIADVGPHLYYGNNTSSSAEPSFVAITEGDLPSDIVTSIGTDLTPLFSSEISSRVLNFTQSPADNGTLFGNFSGASANPTFNAPGTADQILGVTNDGTGLEYKTLTAGENIYLSADVGSITISSTGGGSGGLDNFSAGAAPQNTDDNTEGYSVGSLWLNTANGQLYVCTDASTGAANWTYLLTVPGGTNGSGGVLYNLNGTGYPQPTDDNTEGYSPGSLWYRSGYNELFICTDASTGAANWTYLLTAPFSQIFTPAANDLGRYGLSLGYYWTTATASNPIAFPAGYAYINGTRCNYEYNYQYYSASSWTYDYVDIYGYVFHATQDYDTDPPSLDPTQTIIFQKVVTDADGNITEIDNYPVLWITPSVLSYCQPIPTTAGQLLQSNPSDPHGITYGPLKLTSIDTTGATEYQSVAFNGTNFNLFYGLTGVSVSTDSSITLTSASESLQSLDASGGSISLTLPASSTCAGKVFIISNTASSGSNSVSVSLASGDVLVGSGSLSLNNGKALGVIADGAGNWITIVSL
jgi:hypothetical protein